MVIRLYSFIYELVYIMKCDAFGITQSCRHFREEMLSSSAVYNSCLHFCHVYCVRGYKFYCSFAEVAVILSHNKCS